MKDGLISLSTLLELIMIKFGYLEFAEYAKFFSSYENRFLFGQTGCCLLVSLDVSVYFFHLTV